MWEGACGRWPATNDIRDYALDRQTMPGDATLTDGAHAGCGCAVLLQCYLPLRLCPCNVGGVGIRYVGVRGL